MPAVPSSIIEPIWAQFEALIPERIDTHPLGCHRPRIPDRVVFDQLVRVLVLGASYEKIADPACSATTLRRRRDEWIAAGVFRDLERIVLASYDKIIGLNLDDVAIDGCIVKAPCGGNAAGRSPVDRGKLGTKRSLLVDGNGIPLGAIVAPANTHDSPLLDATLDLLTRFDLPARTTVHLDAGYDNQYTPQKLATRGLHGRIARRGTPAPVQIGKRWVIERTNSWHTRGFTKLAICTEKRAHVIHAWIALANAIITTRALIRAAWIRYRWPGRPRQQP